MRTLFVSHTYVVGINQGKLSAIATTNQAEVALLVPGRWKARGWQKLYYLESTYSNINYYPAQVLLGGIGGGYFYFPFTPLQVIKKFKPDILQVEQEAFSLCALEMAICSRLTGIPLVLFVWENQERNLSFPRNWMCQFVLNTAKLIIAGNQDGKQELRRLGYTGAIEVMPQMGVDTKTFSPQLRSNKDNPEFSIGYMGRMVHHKGLDVLFEAVKHLRDKGYNFHVSLCGSGKDEAKLKKLAHKDNLETVINWKGKVPHAEVPQEMGKFDVLVLPSRSVKEWKEQFGHILIEAMAMGIPVVGSNCGEIPHVIGREDLVFPEEKAMDLADIIEKMMLEPDYCQEVSEYGKLRVEELYTHERIAQRLVQQWFKVLEG